MTSTAKPATPVRDGWITTGAWASSQEVADYISLPTSTIQRWARTGELPAIKIGGKFGVLRFRKLDVERWLTKQPKASG